MTLVEGNLKVSFSIASVGKGATPFSALLHFTFDLFLIMLIVKQGRIKHHFGMTRPGIEPWSPGPLANTLLIRPIQLKIDK